MTRKILLICGIVSSLLYVAMNVFVPTAAFAAGAVRALGEVASVDRQHVSDGTRPESAACVIRV